MWSLSLPPDKRPSYLGDSPSHMIQYASQHKYMVIGTIILTLAVASLIVIMTMQNSAARNGNTDSVSLGAHSTLMAGDQSSINEQPAAIEAPSDQTASDQMSFSSPNVKTELKVNNQSIPIPENGSVQKTIESSDGSSSVNVSVNSSTNGSNTSSSSTSVQVNSSSQSEVSSDNTE